MITFKIIYNVIYNITYNPLIYPPTPLWGHQAVGTVLVALSL